MPGGAVFLSLFSVVSSRFLRAFGPRARPRGAPAPKASRVATDIRREFGVPGIAVAVRTRGGEGLANHRQMRHGSAHPQSGRFASSQFPPAGRRALRLRRIFFRVFLNGQRVSPCSNPQVRSGWAGSERLRGHALPLLSYHDLRCPPGTSPPPPLLTTLSLGDCP
jgi:hypothetical protein